MMKHSCRCFQIQALFLRLFPHTTVQRILEEFGRALKKLLVNSNLQRTFRIIYVLLFLIVERVIWFLECPDDFNRPQEGYVSTLGKVNGIAADVISVERKYC